MIFLLKHEKNIINLSTIIFGSKLDWTTFQAGNYMFKVNNRNTTIRCEICSKLTIKTPEPRQWSCSGLFIVNFEHISHLVLVFILIDNLKQVNSSWILTIYTHYMLKFNLLLLVLKESPSLHYQFVCNKNH